VVAALLYDGMSPFELGIVSEVFGLPRPELGADRYELRVCAAGPVRGLGGLTLAAEHDLAVFAAADTLVLPGVSDVHGEVPGPVLDAVRQAHRRGARLVSICSGAFALAAAGVLDGRRTATHWRYAALLAERYPRVTVDADVLYLDEGDLLTSAGSAAGIDLCLHLVRRDHGSEVANEVARRLVVPPHRDGGQAQFVQLPVAPEPEDRRIAASMDHALLRLGHPLTVDELARFAGMSRRSYLRHFRLSTGTTPIRWLTGQRLRASLPLLERGTPVEQVAVQVGLDPVTFRTHFRAQLSTSPSGYRRTFRTDSPA